MAYIQLKSTLHQKILQEVMGSRLHLVLQYGILDDMSQIGLHYPVYEVPHDVPTTRRLLRQDSRPMREAPLYTRREAYVFSEESLPVFLAQRVFKARSRYGAYACVKAEKGYEKIVLKALYGALLLWQARRMKEFVSMARYVLVKPDGERVPVIPTLFPGDFYRVKFPEHTVEKRGGRGSFKVSPYKAPPRPDLTACPYKTIEVPLGRIPPSEYKRVDQRMRIVQDYFRTHSHPPMREGYDITLKHKVRRSHALRYLFYTSRQNNPKSLKRRSASQIIRTKGSEDRRMARFRRR